MSAQISRTNTSDLQASQYDGQIRLLDSTGADVDDGAALEPGESWRRLARNPTRTSVKEQLSRRKYASWRRDKFGNDVDDSNASREADAGAATAGKTNKTQAAVTEVHPENEESQTVDFGAQPSTSDVADQAKPNQPMTIPKRSEKPDQQVDILYENQRGSFFCGIPLYSHSSLLNFDPAAWVTRDFKNSPVNITNAQVPDPSWMWAWKTWYVDMSADVDEEGWQYSFMFGKNFSWHGTHPWFHSFVRRRRWLRKRVKRSDKAARKEGDASLEGGHHLNADYFTIHSRPRERSPVGDSTNPEARLARPVSFASHGTSDQEVAKTEEMKDVPSLMKAIKLSTIDREKVDALKQFVSTAGEEILYLSEKIPEIMSSLVFQNSKRQILQYLKDQAESAQQHREQHDAEDRPEGDEEKRRIDNLLKAAEAANQEIQGLEYWSDRKHVLQTEDELDVDDIQQSREGVGEIKGISEKAEITAHVRVDRRLNVKGKEAERSNDDESKEKEDLKAEPHIIGDSLVIPDKGDDDDDDNKSVDEDAWKGNGQPIYL
ncbi:hypothetical protein LTS08_004463 [Lithohypha guttulata]|uniref:Peroxin/Ferlin domain-containing protein n=1 Tax=Lithohypha guttulata TaxID=1690604 RepID=A0AAN7SU14_9EURO|nr:hypothetical protein LTR51_007574 [Lithohypha guttulata]KAK5081341.1 hypothetical protein LTR05_008135 [Lithohypha guttulata]KAK5102003.1 hypothetical protein LTS08_004463 [Lithohypha guttulata]